MYDLLASISLRMCSICTELIRQGALWFGGSYAGRSCCDFSPIYHPASSVSTCATAHHWAREFGKLGHTCRLIPARYVKAYLKTNKNDLRDAEAICEALQRPTMHFVAVKSVDQQAVLLLHRSRELLISQRTQLGNSIRSQLAEFGVYLRLGSWTLPRQIAELQHQESEQVPAIVRSLVELLLEQWRQVQERILHLERQIDLWHRESEQSKRLADIPGIGPITASAMLATVGDIHAFRSARHFAAWLGLVPKQHSTGGKPLLGRYRSAETVIFVDYWCTALSP